MRSLWGDGGAYGRWAGHLERWARGEDGGDGSGPADLPPLRPEDFPPDVWDRLLQRLRAAIETRLQAWADALTAALAKAPDEFSVGRALAQARTGLHSVRALAGHPALPDGVRAGLVDMVDRQIRTFQEELERTVRRQARDTRRAEKRLRTLRDNALTAVLAGPPAAPGPPPVPARDPLAPTRRRVVVDP